MSTAVPAVHLPTRADLVRTWFAAAVTGTASLLLLFSGYEFAERLYFRDALSTDMLFLLHIVRGVSASVLVGTLSVVIVWRLRSRYEAAFLEAHRKLEEAMARRIAESVQLQAHVRHQEKMAAIGMLSAGIAHDIANPLASMSSELEMLEDEGDLHQVRRLLAEVRRQVARIGRILREMTDFARRRGEDASTFPLRVVVDDAPRMVRHDRARGGSTWRWICPPRRRLRCARWRTIS
ncbi:MAG: histidine kinase dimerization/phospho-acceptor domain-containing protein [Polyangiaceae bacterium]